MEKSAVLENIQAWFTNVYTSVRSIPQAESAYSLVFTCTISAVHANQALTILGDSATKDEREILGEFQTSRNVCVLHSDETQIPKPGERDSPGHILVSMNPIHSPRAVQSTHIYHHPVITSNSVLASKRLHLINGVSHVHFAGAWMGYGFHEDGFSAGAKVAQSILDGSMVGEEEIVYGNELAIRRENQSIWSLIARFMVGLIQEIIVAVEDF
ncbi:MAG: hypothetical protein Q9157_004437 [Trypethelium eluteriae]